MSDAPVAPIVENGVTPPTQDQVEETPGFKVFAGNLAYSTTDEGLKAFFDPVKDDVLSAQVIMRGQRPAGYGFVALATEEAAKKAVEELNKKELDGRPVIVEIAKPADQKDREKKERKVNKRRPGRRGGKAVPGEVTEAEANGEPPRVESATASGTEGAAKPRKRKSPRKPRVRADNVATDNTPAAEGDGEAVATETTSAAKKPRRKFKTSRPPRPVGQDPVGELSKTMLFVANLGFNIDDAGLSALFSEVGIPVVSARIVRRRWGQPRKSKGYGFVDVGSEEQQVKAIEALQGKDVGGRTIAVKVAVNTTAEDSSDETKLAEVDATAPAAAVVD